MFNVFVVFFFFLQRFNIVQGKWENESLNLDKVGKTLKKIPMRSASQPILSPIVDSLGLVN